MIAKQSPGANCHVIASRPLPHITAVPGFLGSILMVVLKILLS